MNITVDWEALRAPSIRALMGPEDGSCSHSVICRETGQGIANLTSWRVVGAEGDVIKLEVSAPLEFQAEGAGIAFTKDRVTVGLNWDDSRAGRNGPVMRSARPMDCDFPVVICLETGEVVGNVHSWEIVGALDEMVMLVVTLILRFPAQDSEEGGLGGLNEDYHVSLRCVREAVWGIRGRCGGWDSGICRGCPSRDQGSGNGADRRRLGGPAHLQAVS